MPADTLNSLPRLSRVVGKSQISDDLVDPALYQARGERHIASAEAVAQRPRLHLAIALQVAVWDLVVHRAQLAHGLGLALDWYMRHRVGWSKILVGQEGITMWSHARRIIY